MVFEWCMALCTLANSYIYHVRTSKEGKKKKEQKDSELEATRTQSAHRETNIPIHKKLREKFIEKSSECKKEEEESCQSIDPGIILENSIYSLQLLVQK
jgi:hypothetical protein